MFCKFGSIMLQVSRIAVQNQHVMTEGSLAYPCAGIVRQ